MSVSSRFELKPKTDTALWLQPRRWFRMSGKSLLQDLNLVFSGWYLELRE